MKQTKVAWGFVVLGVLSTLVLGLLLWIAFGQEDFVTVKQPMFKIQHGSMEVECSCVNKAYLVCTSAWIIYKQGEPDPQPSIGQGLQVIPGGCEP